MQAHWSHFSGPVETEFSSRPGRERREQPAQNIFRRSSLGHSVLQLNVGVHGGAASSAESGGDLVCTEFDDLSPRSRKSRRQEGRRKG